MYPRNYFSTDLTQKKIQKPKWVTKCIVSGTATVGIQFPNSPVYCTHVHSGKHPREGLVYKEKEGKGNTTKGEEL